MSLTLLAIDDSPTLRKFIAKHLSERFSDARVLVAANGTEGVEKSVLEKPDLVLLDFMLPDFNGDEVCRRLAAGEETKSIPIVLMSSSAKEVEKLEGEFESVRRTMVKPFSPELLCASVSMVLKQVGKGVESVKKTEPPTPPEPVPAVEAPKPEPVKEAALPTPVGGAAPGREIVFCGNLGYFPLITGLRVIEAERLTGVLRIHCGESPVELFCREGLPVLATTKDADRYLKGTDIQVAPEQEEFFGGLKKAQSEDGFPLFFQLRDKQIIPEDRAAALADQTGQMLFADAWLSSGSRYEFEKLAELPAYTANHVAGIPGMDAWAMSSVRYVGEGCLNLVEWGTPAGMPSYTRLGYDRIQQLALEEEELTFATHVGQGGMTIGDIAAAMQCDINRTRCLLFRFLCLEIFDFWPVYE